MKLSEILKNVNITGLFADADLEISALCYDSRRAVPGCLFIAMRGFESDGHDFVAAAVERGAACVLCERAPEVSIPYAISPDTRAALAIASAEWFGNPAEKLRIIG
ncbi:MAG: Mur ligase domain-containing protein, partial [Oscillospiraceae bacterium]|nr:Mur ligase domain-containing protein [Oscillospiraceae bacterium]